MSDKFEAGKLYILKHSRFGTATVKLVHVGRDGEWADIEIVAGQLTGMNDTWLPGDTKTVRLSHCEWEAVTP
jgi:hypothetical protein